MATEHQHSHSHSHSHSHDHGHDPVHDQGHDHHHDHDGGHRHGHHHHAPGQPHAPQATGASLLRLSVPARLGVAGFAIVLLWTGILVAMR